MPKPKIRPPRMPKSEPHKVTIANLNLQVKLLTQRCVDLVTARDQQSNHVTEYRSKAAIAAVRTSEDQKQILGLREALKGCEKRLCHLVGYQERVREEDKHRYGDLGVAS